MSETHEISLSDMLKGLQGKLADCVSRADQLMRLQIGRECPCLSPNVLMLYRILDDCRFISSSLNINTDKSSLMFPLVNCVNRRLYRAKRCIRGCRPAHCDANCVSSCEKERKLTTTCLEESMQSSPEPKHGDLLKYLLNVFDNPRVVMCHCRTHLNTLNLSASLHMASSVLSSVIEPLFAVESSSVPHTNNSFLQEGSIHMAALRSSVVLAKKAIESGQSVNLLDEFGNSALHIASILENATMVEFLLENGADPCIANESGNTPLLLATITQNPRSVELLCSREANILATNSNGLSPLLLVLSLQDKQLFQIMLKYQEISISLVKVNKVHENKIVDQPKNIQDSPEQGPGSPGDLHEEIVSCEEDMEDLKLREGEEKEEEGGRMLNQRVSVEGYLPKDENL